jgi:hypothetical protein
VREHLFGKVLRVDRVQPQGRDALDLELEDFVNAALGMSQPRVSGEDALRAVRLADQVLRCLQAHRWDADLAPAAAPTPEAASVLRGPHAWRSRSMRQSANRSTR